MAMLAERRRKAKFVLHPVSKPLWSQESIGIQFGKKMMEKMGWSAGKGLGASEQGICEPVRALYKQDSKGMGYSGDGNPFENLDHFNALLSTLSGNVEIDSEETHTYESLEEKSKHSKSRVHYKKFTRGKDISRYSRGDLTCIVGTGKKPDLDEEPEEEPDRTGETEKSHGITTINGGSISDYFRIMKEKMKNLGRRSEDSSQNDDCGTAVATQDNELSSDKNGKKEKNKKLAETDNGSLDYQYQDNETILEVQTDLGQEFEDTLPRNNKKAKKKHKKAKRRDPESVDDNFDSKYQDNEQIVDEKKNLGQDPSTADFTSSSEKKRKNENLDHDHHKHLDKDDHQLQVKQSDSLIGDYIGNTDDNEASSKKKRKKDIKKHLYKEDHMSEEVETIVAEKIVKQSDSLIGDNHGTTEDNTASSKKKSKKDKRKRLNKDNDQPQDDETIGEGKTEVKQSDSLTGEDPETIEDNEVPSKKKSKKDKKKHLNKDDETIGEEKTEVKQSDSLTGEDPETIEDNEVPSKKKSKKDKKKHLNKDDDQPQEDETIGEEKTEVKQSDSLIGDDPETIEDNEVPSKKKRRKRENAVENVDVPSKKRKKELSIAGEPSLDDHTTSEASLSYKKKKKKRDGGEVEGQLEQDENENKDTLETGDVDLENENVPKKKQKKGSEIKNEVSSECEQGSSIDNKKKHDSEQEMIETEETPVISEADIEGSREKPKKVSKELKKVAKTFPGSNLNKLPGYGHSRRTLQNSV